MMQAPSRRTRPIAPGRLLALAAILLLLFPLLAPLTPGAAAPLAAPAAPDSTRVEAGLRNSPVMFIENVGQFDPSTDSEQAPSTGSGQAQRARFQVRGATGTMWLAEEAVWITVVEPSTLTPSPSPWEGEGSKATPPSAPPRHGEGDAVTSPSVPPRVGEGSLAPPLPGRERGLGGEGRPRRGVHLKLSFPGANPHPRLEPFDRLETHVSYFLGNDPAKWHPDVPVWGGVRYVDLYPGVDLEISSEAGRWSWQLICRANCQFAQRGPRLRLEGAEALTVDAAGRVHATTALGELTLPPLRLAGPAATPLAATVQGDVVTFSAEPSVDAATQPSTPSRESSSFNLQPSKLHNPSTDSGQRLQPSTPSDNPDDLLYATFLGGGDSDYSWAITVDGTGAAYVTGSTFSADFPTTPGAFDPNNNYGDAFVVKLNATGSALQYATFLGGSSGDWGDAIAVDAADAAYVTGVTYSPDFPTTPGAFNPSFNGGPRDAFVVKLNASGAALNYATFLGGSDYDSGYGIAVDGAGAAYVTGDTKSPDFPTTPGAFDPSHNGYVDAFVVKLNASGTAFHYATFVGGSSGDSIRAITVDGTGAAYVTGSTASADFPTTPGAFDPSHNGYYSDAFVVKLNASGTALHYATFLGESNLNEGSAIAVDGMGAAYVTGEIYSPNFATTPSIPDPSYYNAFVVKLNASGAALDYATFLGGSDYDSGRAIAVDGAGAAYVTGQTDSPDFPTTPGAFDTSPNGYDDAFVVKLNASGEALDYATFLGGRYIDSSLAITVDGASAAYVTGLTGSPDFPTTPGAFDSSSNGDADAFVVKLAMGGGVCPDFNDSGTVDVADIQAVAGRWGQRSGDPGWDPRFDLNGDGDIDLGDAQRAAVKWQRACS